MAARRPVFERLHKKKQSRKLEDRELRAKLAYALNIPTTHPVPVYCMIDPDQLCGFVRALIRLRIEHWAIKQWLKSQIEGANLLGLNKSNYVAHMMGRRSERMTPELEARIPIYRAAVARLDKVKAEKLDVWAQARACGVHRRSLECVVDRRMPSLDYANEVSTKRVVAFEVMIAHAEEKHGIDGSNRRNQPILSLKEITRFKRQCATDGIPAAASELASRIMSGEADYAHGRLDPAPRDLRRTVQSELRVLQEPDVVREEGPAPQPPAEGDGRL